MLGKRTLKVGKKMTAISAVAISLMSVAPELQAQSAADLKAMDDPAVWAKAFGAAPADRGTQSRVVDAIQNSQAQHAALVRASEGLRAIPLQSKYRLSLHIQDSLTSFTGPDLLLTYLEAIPQPNDYTLYCGAGVYDAGRSKTIFAFSDDPDGVVDMHLTEAEFEAAGCFNDELAVRLR